MKETQTPHELEQDMVRNELLRLREFEIEKFQHFMNNCFNLYRLDKHAGYLVNNLESLVETLKFIVKAVPAKS